MSALMGEADVLTGVPSAPTAWNSSACVLQDFTWETMWRHAWEVIRSFYIMYLSHFWSRINSGRVRAVVRHKYLCVLNKGSSRICGEGHRHKAQYHHIEFQKIILCLDVRSEIWKKFGKLPLDPKCRKPPDGHTPTILHLIHRRKWIKSYSRHGKHALHQVKDVLFEKIQSGAKVALHDASIAWKLNRFHDSLRR